MDIVFQFGEFIGEDGSFWTDLIVGLVGSIVGGFIGTGGAIWLYYRQVRDQKTKEDANRSQIQTDKLKYLHNLLNSIILATDTSIEAIVKQYKAVEAHPTHLPGMKIVAVYDFNRIVNVINHEEHYHAYVTKLKDENITTIFSIVDFLFGSLLDLEKNFNEIVQYDLGRRKNFAESVQEIIDCIIVNQKKLKDKKGEKDIYYNILNNSIFKYYASLEPDPSNFLNIRDSFLTPFIEETVRIKDSEEIYQVTRLASKSSKLLTPIILSNMQHAGELKALSEVLSNANDRLRNYIKPLSSFSRDN
ncbi:hypothetical protein GCM10028808_10360 [Spirosoma migulaei]